VSFWDLLATLGEDKWASGNYQVRVYRVWPIIERRQPDGVFLAIVKEPIDEAHLPERFGSGRYLLLFKHFNKLLRKLTISVNDPSIAPKVHESEVLRDEPENHRYFQIWGKTKSNSSSARQEKDEGRRDADILEILRAHNEGRAAEAAAHETTAAHRDSLAIKLAELNAQNSAIDWPSLIQAIKGMVPSADPMAIADRILTAKKDNSPPPADALALLAAVKQLQPEPADPLQVLQLAKEIFSPAPGANGADDLARFERFLNVADKLASWRGGSGHESGWQTALNFVKEAPAVISPILTFIGNTMAMRNGGMAPQAAPGAPGPPASWNPYENQAATAAYARTLRSQPAPPASAPPAASPTDGAPPAASATPDQELQMIFQQYGQLVLNSLNNAVPGYEFAENVIALFGAGTHAAFANYGESQLVSAMMNISEFQVFGKPRLSQFAHEFCHFQEFGGDEEDGDAVKSTSAAR
jgi:hypothetical protein